MKEPGQEKEKSDPKEWVGETAWGPAESRVHTNIPFSEEVYEESKRLSAEDGKPYKEQAGTESMSRTDLLLFEARFKFISQLVRENKSKQILEIASGYSSRGIEMAQDASVIYVELDKFLAHKKRAIINNLVFGKKIPEEPNLHILGGDAVISQDLEAAVQFFSNKPLTITNEGLFRYLTLEERAILGKNIHKLLSRFGGVWITPDLIPDIPGMKKADEEAFENKEQFTAFFERLGFTVEQRNFEEITNELVSPKQIGFSEKETRDIMKKTTAFLMSVAK